MANDRKLPPEIPQDAPKPQRRAYVKPAFRHEQVFETMALACGKTGPPACKGPKKS